MRVLEGRELGRAAGSAKGKPKIEFYDKDRKKGMGALVTPAKVDFFLISQLHLIVLVVIVQWILVISDPDCYLFMYVCMYVFYI